MCSCIKQELCKGIHRQLFACQQTDGYNCGPFAIAFATEILDGKSSMEARLDVKGMRGLLINCLENKVLIPFPKV